MHNTLDHFLAAPNGAGSLMAHLRRLAGAQRAYSQIVPPYLGDASRIANCKQGIVVINADNGAVAAKLRQMATRLAGELMQRGVECSGVQIRVQAANPTPAASPMAARPFSENARQTVSQAAHEVHDPELRAALERLLQHAGPLTPSTPEE